jgi:hypothetical protein
MKPIRCIIYTGCPTIYQTRQFFNNSKTNEDIATRFEQEYVRRWEMRRNVSVVRVFVRMKFRCNILIIKDLPGLVGSGTPYTSVYWVTIHLHVSGLLVAHHQ